MTMLIRVMCPKDTDRIANSVDSDQTAPEAPSGAVCSGSTLFAGPDLSEYLQSWCYSP